MVLKCSVNGKNGFVKAFSVLKKLFINVYKKRDKKDLKKTVDNCELMLVKNVNIFIRAVSF